MISQVGTLDLATILLEGGEISLHQMDSMALSDKQRQNLIKFSEKRTRLLNLKDRLAKSTETRPSETEVDPYEDQPVKKEVRSNHLPKNVLVQIDQLEQEISQLMESLLAAANHASVDTGDMKRRKLEAQFGNDDEESLEIPNTFSTIYPEIPSLGLRENIDSIRVKKERLQHLRQESENAIAEHEAAKTASCDDEEDPLDAFMNSTSDQLVDEKIEKEKKRLAEIVRVFSQIEKVESELKKNQFVDSSLRSAVAQQDLLKTAKPSPVEKNLSVWPERTVKPSHSASNMVVNPTVGGLYMLQGGKSVLVAPAPVSAPTDSTETQNALRKKLGY